MNAVGNSKLVRWLLHRVSPCQKVIRLVEESLDRRLSLGEKIALKFYIFLCSYCFRFKEQLEAMRRILQPIQDELDNGIPDGSTHLSPDARERIKKVLRDTAQDIEDAMDDSE